MRERKLTFAAKSDNSSESVAVRLDRGHYTKISVEGGVTNILDICFGL